MVWGRWNYVLYLLHNLETFMSSAATVFVHATLKHSQKVPRAKNGTFWFPRMDYHDSWFKYHSIALVFLYNIRLEWSFGVDPKLHAVKRSINFCSFTIETLNRICINQWQSLLGVVQRYCAAITGLLEGLQKVVKVFITSLLCHHHTLTTVYRESAQAATAMVRGPRWSS